MATLQDYAVDVRPTWCSGCGNHSTWNALKRAFVQLGYEPRDLFMVTGVGCCSKMNDYMRINGIHTLHGRSLAVAAGVRLASGKKVITVHGDGDGYGEGGNHFMHAARRNLGFVDIVENNQVYALTRGQVSPTSRLGFRSSTSPGGSLERPVNPLALALSQGATFVARGATHDMMQLVELIVAAMQHRGYALIDVMQVCVTYNRAMPYDYYRERAYKVEEVEGYDATDWNAAMAFALEYPATERIPTGILYRREDLPAYEEGVSALKAGPLVEQPLRTRPLADIDLLLREHM
ncbi:MAG: thiamine pyrophosphate-dependent enzyme [Anaerolineae bacterium]|jgi:2-oxoglutarate ferredoxin oxidoreductase subunit beta|nr:2-oxoacid ferredoxin oxidoreductase [Chloroflexota bacterium]